MSYYATNDIDRAVELYIRQRKGDARVDQPNRYHCTQEGDLIILANCVGVLARYKVLPSGRLRTLPIEETEAEKRRAIKALERDVSKQLSAAFTRIVNENRRGK